VFALTGVAHAGAATLTLAWDPPSDGRTAGFLVWYGKTSRQYTAYVDAGLQLKYAVDGLADGTTYCFAVQAYDSTSTTSAMSSEVCSRTPDAAPPSGGEPRPADPTTAADVVIYASKAIVAKGNWAAASSSGAAGGRAMRSADLGWSTSNTPQTAPANHFELTFTASANTPYRIWLRLRAGGNSKWNDSVWVQFSDALVNGRATYRIGTTSALLVNLEPCSGCGTSDWGWHNTAYWLAQATAITFAQSGSHTIRVQTREDGVEIDQIVLSPSTYLSNSPGPVRGDATILPESGATTGAPGMSEIVVHASDAQTTRGNWAAVSSSSAAGGKTMRSADYGWAASDLPSASPANYFDVRFDAAAGTAYRVWLRLRGGGNSKWNDSVWVQFSDALVDGRSAYRIGTTEALLVNLERCNACGISGWGWQNTAYWIAQNTTVTFARSGPQTIRIQTREDGVGIDQIVLSAAKYKTTAPGSATNDTTTLPKTTSAFSSTPYSGTPMALPGTIDAAYFDHGGANIAYADTSPGNTGGAFRATDVDLEASSLGGHNLGWTEAGEWVRYTVNVQTAGTYTAQFRVASVGGGAVRIAAGTPSADTRDVVVPDTRGWQSWTTVGVPITLAAGQQTFTVRFLTGGVNLRSIGIR
jgi:hypothetical protein